MTLIRTIRRWRKSTPPPNRVPENIRGTPESPTRRIKKGQTKIKKKKKTRGLFFPLPPPNQPRASERASPAGQPSVLCSPRAGDAVREGGPHDPRVLAECALPLGLGDHAGGGDALREEVEDAAQPVDEADGLRERGARGERGLGSVSACVFVRAVETVGGWAKIRSQPPNNEERPALSPS